MKSSEETFTSQRLSLSMSRWGHRDNRPLILVHGGRDQKRAWDRTACHLAETHHVITYDLRGHGRSDWVNDGDYAVLDHVFDLATLVDHLGYDQVTLIGHSLGGNIVLRYAGLLPERVDRLVCIEGLGPNPKQVAERKAQSSAERAARWVERRRALSGRDAKPIKDMDDARQRMQTVQAKLTSEQLDHLISTGTRTLPDGTLRWLYDPAGLGPSPADFTIGAYDDYCALVKRISCPVLLLYATNSFMTNPQTDGRLAMFAEPPAFELFEDAGHWLHHEQFEPFIARVQAFLNEAASTVG